jgi:Reverse transcriptase (RNA-dependent DNA polymerase)
MKVDFQYQTKLDFRARLVARGYSQIPGIDFNESFTPAMYDVNPRIMLVADLIWNLLACIVDVETAFLHAELQEDIYMNIPECMHSDSNNYVVLTKIIYGLEQSARELYKKLINSWDSKVQDCFSRSLGQPSHKLCPSLSQFAICILHFSFLPIFRFR